MQTEVCSHYPKRFDKKNLTAALSDYANAKCCSKIHEENSEIKSAPPDELWICLTTMKLLCGRSSPGQCMIKHSEENPECQVVASFKKNMIWCYKCDDSAQNIIQMAKEFNENSHEDKELQKFEAFFSDVCKAFVDARCTGMENKENEDTEEMNSDTGVEAELEQEIAQGDELSKYISPSKKYIGKSVFGSSNLGNTCFFNSAMQCLNATRPLVEQYIDNRELFESHNGILQSKLQL